MNKPVSYSLPSSFLSALTFTDSHNLTHDSGARVTGSIAAREVMRVVAPGAIEQQEGVQ